MKTMKLSSSQYKMIAHYIEDISKAIVVSNVAGYFLPSILSTNARPTEFHLISGLIVSLTTFVFAVILIRKAEK